MQKKYSFKKPAAILASIVLLVTFTASNCFCQTQVKDYFPWLPDGYKKEYLVYLTLQIPGNPYPDQHSEYKQYNWVDGSINISGVDYMRHYQSTEGFFAPTYEVSYLAQEKNQIIQKGGDDTYTGGSKHLNEPHMLVMKFDLDIGESHTYSYTCTLKDHVQYIDQTITIVGIENIQTHYGFFTDSLKYKVLSNVHSVLSDGSTQDDSVESTFWVLSDGQFVRWLTIPKSGPEWIQILDFYNEDMPTGEPPVKALNNILSLLLNR